MRNAGWVIAVIASLAASTGFKNSLPATPSLLAQVGCRGCPGEDEAFAPADLLVADGGVVWVLDNFPPLVRGFTFAGNPIHKYGGIGEGPGEVQAPFSLHQSSNGNLVVHSALPASVLTLDSAFGQEVERTPIAMRVPLNAAFNRDTDVLFVQSFFFGETGSRIDRIAIAEGESVPVVKLGTDEFPGEEDAPLETRARFAMGVSNAGEVLVGRAWDYVIERYSAAGSFLGEITGEVVRPEGRAHFDRHGLEFDVQGNRLWVRTFRGDTDVETTFDVWSASGEFLGSVVIPVGADRSFSSYAVRGDVLASFHDDPDGNNVLSIFRVEVPD